MRCLSFKYIVYYGNCMTKFFSQSTKHTRIVEMNLNHGTSVHAFNTFHAIYKGNYEDYTAEHSFINIYLFFVVFSLAKRKHFEN